jgi:hypothetical protein
VIGQRIWAIDTDGEVEVDYEQSVSIGNSIDNDVSGFDVEVGNAMAMQKCDTFYQLSTQIHDIDRKRPKCEFNS